MDPKEIKGTPFFVKVSYFLKSLFLFRPKRWRFVSTKAILNIKQSSFSIQNKALFYLVYLTKVFKYH